MFVVYWLELLDEGDDLAASPTHVPRATTFGPTEMTPALEFMEALRKSSVNSFVTFASENPNSVGKPGVDITGPDYDWRKRRD